MTTSWLQAGKRSPTESTTSESASATEAELVVRAKQDPQAFAPLYDRYVSQIFGYCLRRVVHRETAADLTAQIFTRALANLTQYQPSGRHETSFRSWLFTIAHNLVIDHSRRNRYDTSLEAVESEGGSHPRWRDPAPGPEALAIAAEEHEQVRALLAQLPDRQRSIVELRMAGLNGVEIARVMQITHSAVKSAQFRAYATLRGLIQAERSREPGA